VKLLLIQAMKVKSTIGRQFCRARAELQSIAISLANSSPPTATPIPRAASRFTYAIVVCRRYFCRSGNSACGPPEVCWLHPSRPPHSSCRTLWTPRFQIQLVALAHIAPKLKSCVILLAKVYIFIRLQLVICQVQPKEASRR